MAAKSFTGFHASLVKFLTDLNGNNQREWFNKNKGRYENDVLFPALSFVEAFEPRLKQISPFFLALPKRVGGSVMRIYRDTRFSKDKRPYKTNVGIHFRHEMGGDVHCPGFYVHLEPQQCFLGVGIWHPDSQSLKSIRGAIDESPAQWKRVRDNKTFRAHFDLAGDQLKTPPRGYDKDHPLIDDLKRKDFIAVKPLTAKAVTAPKFIDDVASAFSSSKPFVRFLCEAINVPF